MMQVRMTLHAANVLYYFDHRQTAVSLLKDVLKTTIYYERPEYAAQACLYLSRYTAFSGNRRYRHYSKLYTRLKELNDAIIRSEELEQRTTYLILNITGYTPRIKKQVADCYQEMLALRRKHPSQMIMLRYYRMAIRYHHSRWEYGHIVRSARACVRKLRADTRYQLPQVEDEFRLHEMEACLQSGRLGEAYETIRRIRPAV